MRWPIAGWAARISTFSSCGSSWTRVGGDAERIGLDRESLDEAAVALEERRELVGAQLPR